MIKKSYLIEENIQSLKENLALFYGENVGLINEFRDKIKNNYANKKIIKLNQEELLKDKNLLINEIRNVSLFENTKIIFIENVSDNISNLIESIILEIDSNKIFLFANILEKKSKLRKLLETSKGNAVIPCYKDNEIGLRKIIINKLNGYNGLSTQIINLLIENCNLDRLKLNNEIEKIKTFFSEKNLKIEQIEQLININIDEDFEAIKDSALNGNNYKTNKLLSNTVFDADKIPFYINVINQRLNKLKTISTLLKDMSILEAIDSIKPPIFWKDKPNVKDQSKLWSSDKIKIALQKTYDLEICFKSNSMINKNLLIKKLLLDMCILART